MGDRNSHWALCIALILSFTKGTVAPCDIGYGGAGCFACTNKPTVYWLVYTGPGTTTTNCPYNCLAGDYLSGSNCLSCTNKPDMMNSIYVGPGTTASNCPWNCTTGYYKDATPACQVCTNQVAHSGFIGAALPGETTCAWACVTGYTRANNECIPNKCSVGYYGDGVTCTPCRTCSPNGYKSASCPMGSTTDVTACTCNAGYWGDGVTCTACPTGTYSTSIGSTSYPCVQCPAGTFNSQTGRADVTWCLPCRPGWFGSTTGSNTG